MRSFDGRLIRFHFLGLFGLLAALLSLSACGGPSIPKADLMDSLKKSMPIGLELSDVTFEVEPNQNGQSNATIPVKAKLSATATEDLYSGPTDPAELKPVNDYVNFYNGYIAWTNGLQRTPYADELNRDRPKIEANVPKFLHRDQVKGDTFTGYCDVIAEHQVDRWIFSPVAQIDWGNTKPSAPSSRFGPNCVGANTPDGQAVVRKFADNENEISQFRKRFVDQHVAESGPIVQVLQPLLTGGKEFRTWQVPSPGNEYAGEEFTFSQYDPQTNHFHVRFHSLLGDFMGSGEFVGAYILIFQDGPNGIPSAIAYVGSYDQQSGDVVLLHKDADPQILHTRHK